MAGETVNKPKEPIIVASAPTKYSEMTQEQRDQRFREIRERMSRSRVAVKGDPNKVYYWARKNDGDEMVHLEWLGYEIVHDDPKSPKIKATGLQADGTYVLGDVILMQIDADMKEFLDMENARRARELVEGAKADFVESAQKTGREEGYRIPTFERDEDPRKIAFHK